MYSMNPIHTLLFVLFGNMFLGFTLGWWGASVLGLLGLILTGAAHKHAQDEYYKTQHLEQEVTRLKTGSTETDDNELDPALEAELHAAVEAREARKEEAASDANTPGEASSR